MKNNMWKIIAIWGWDLRKNETLKIDTEIINISNKKNPKLLFIPTASSDSQGYYEWINNYFSKLWCKCDVLYLINKKYTQKQLKDKILNSDIIYVWWGNTLKMMTIWRRLWVDKILKQAYKKWVVLSWLSAWSICWFKYWNSDSRKFTSWTTKLMKVTWLWFLNALHCPHYDTEIHRQKDLKKMMEKSPLVSIAIEEWAAIEIIDEKYRIINSKPNAKAYKIYWKNKKFHKENIEITKEFKSIKWLIIKK